MAGGDQSAMENQNTPGPGGRPAQRHDGEHAAWRQARVDLEYRVPRLPGHHAGALFDIFWPKNIDGRCVRGPGRRFFVGGWMSR